MRRMLTVVGGALLLAACGGSDGGSSPVSVVTGSTPTPTPTPTPTATATPTPTPTPTSAPTSSYPVFASLTGDQNYKTACASLVLGSGLPTPGPSLPFGQALMLAYSGSAASWTITGDAVSQVFTANDKVSAPSGQTSYQHAGASAPQVFTITAPAPSGATLNYTRSLSLRADKSGSSTLYSCVFGVPSNVVDVPATAVSYGKVAVSGTAYVADQNGLVQTYQLGSATTTTSYDPSTRLVSVRMHLIGYLQTGTTVATTGTELGTYSGTASITAGQSIFSGSLDGVDRVSLFSSFSGTFFGGIEIGSAFEIKATDTGTSNSIVVVGTVTAWQ